MTKDETLRLALKALKETWYHVGTFAPTNEAIELYDKAITALRLAIDVENMASESTYKEQLETKDEPVAWMNRHGACKTSLFREMEAGAKEEYTIPVYTTPQRKPLRDEQIRDIAKQYALSLAFPSNSQTTPEMFARAIEAAHGIKE